jgi:pimeloyl-ACP methyl ester carboxylesterase
MTPQTRNHERQAIAVTTHTLKVPGATLYYEVRGSGPTMLIIPGGPAEAGIFSEIAGLLADRYTVVTYDPRGNSRSRLDGPLEDQRVDVHADDAHRLLAEIGTEPAIVVGSSGGALVGLELAVRHPEQVRTLIAHEPPVFELLPDHERWRAFAKDVQDTYRAEGMFPALQKFNEGVGMEGSVEPQGEMPPEVQEMMGRMGGNMELFLSHIVRPFGAYAPDVDALRAGATRIIVAGGDESREKPHPAYQATVALASRLGTKVVHLPGQHGGFSTHAAPFAETLHGVLEGRES